MKIFTAFIVTFTILVFTGCGGSTPAPVKKPAPIPAWVNSILPNDTQTTMYGLATAKTREAAINAALSDMVSRLGTTVESSFESIEKETNNFSELSMKSIIKAEISKIKVNNYKVIKAHRISYREFAVMIATDKPKFIQGLKETLATRKKSIIQKDEALKYQDALTRYNTRKVLSKEASSLLPTILILAEIDASFDKKANTLFVSTKQKEFLNESNRLGFYVAGNRKSAKFIDKIKNYLASRGFHVVSSKRDAVEVKVITTDNVEDSHIRIAVLNVNVSVYDKTKRIGGKNIILKERYNGSLNSVYKNAAIHLEQDVQEKGINDVIGINLSID